MKQIFKSTLLLLVVTELALTLSGCAESHYYHKNRYHTRGWYNKRHQAPPPNAHYNIEIRH